MQGFKNFLINEEQSFLGHRVGDVLTVVQDLESDIDGMGLRQITRISQDIVNQIRKILHSEWSAGQTKYLKELQKIAVSLMKSIEEKDDLKQIIPQLAQNLQQISSKMGQKTNNLKGNQVAASNGVNGTQLDMQLTPPPAQQGISNAPATPPTPPTA